MLQAVINNKIHWCVSVCAVNCTVDRCNCCSHSSSHRSDSQILAENRDFCIAHLHSRPPLGGPRRNIAITFGTEKLERRGYPVVQNVKDILFVSTEYTNVTDGRTDGRTDTGRRHRPLLCIASRGKNHPISIKSGTQQHIWNLTPRWHNMNILKIPGVGQSPF